MISSSANPVKSPSWLCENVSAPNISNSGPFIGGFVLYLDGPDSARSFTDALGVSSVEKREFLLLLYSLREDFICIFCYT